MRNDGQLVSVHLAPTANITIAEFHEINGTVKFGVSPQVREHFTNSRIEFLKGIRAVIDSRIEHLSNAGQRGTKISVE